MNRIGTAKGLMLALICATASTNSIATSTVNPDTIGTPDCDSPSPALQQLGEHYFEIRDRAPIAPALAARLDEFHQSLLGTWYGYQTDHYCTGTSAVRRQKYFAFERLDTEAHTNGVLTFRGDRLRLERPPQTRRHHSAASVISMQPNQHLDLFPAMALQQLQIIDDDTIRTTQRYRQSNPVASQLTGGDLEPGMRLVSLRERRDVLLRRGDTLAITTHWYINGYYSGTETTYLARQR